MLWRSRGLLAALVLYPIVLALLVALVPTRPAPPAHRGSTTARSRPTCRSARRRSTTPGSGSASADRVDVVDMEAGAAQQALHRAASGRRGVPSSLVGRPAHERRAAQDRRHRPGRREERALREVERFVNLLNARVQREFLNRRSASRRVGEGGTAQIASASDRARAPARPTVVSRVRAQLTDPSSGPKCKRSSIRAHGPAGGGVREPSLRVGGVAVAVGPRPAATTSCSAAAASPSRWRPASCSAACCSAPPRWRPSARSARCPGGCTAGSPVSAGCSRRCCRERRVALLAISGGVAGAGVRPRQRARGRWPRRGRCRGRRLRRAHRGVRPRPRVGRLRGAADRRARSCWPRWSGAPARDRAARQRVPLQPRHLGRRRRAGRRRRGRPLLHLACSASSRPASPRPTSAGRRAPRRSTPLPPAGVAQHDVPAVRRGGVDEHRLGAGVAEEPVHLGRPHRAAAAGRRTIARSDTAVEVGHARPRSRRPAGTGSRTPCASACPGQERPRQHHHGAVVADHRRSLPSANSAGSGTGVFHRSAAGDGVIGSSASSTSGEAREGARRAPRAARTHGDGQPAYIGNRDGSARCSSGSFETSSHGRASARRRAA